MNVAAVSHTFPTKNDPSYGIFIKRELELISNFAGVALIVPQVISTPLNKQFYRTKHLIEADYPIHACKYLSFPRRSLSSITQSSLSGRLIELLSNIPIDIIHIHWLYPSAIAIPELKKIGKKVILTSHGGDWYTNLNRGKLTERIYHAMHQSDIITTVGASLKEDILAKLPELAGKIHHVPHAIDTSIFKPSDDKKSIKNELNWVEDKLNLLCVGNMYQGKGIEVLVEAFAKSKAQNDSILHIVKARVDPKVKQKVDELFTTFNLKNRIHIYNTKTEYELIKMYQAADFYIQPSLKEGFGIVTAEAASCGLPVLSTRCGGPEEIIDSDTGIFVEAGSVSALVKGIDLMVEKFSNFDSVKLHQSIDKRFGMTHKRQKLEDLYSSLL